jgi:hypothetical protein
MDKLIIEGTHFTPRVEYNPEKGVLEIEGRVLETGTENAQDIFTRIGIWMETNFYGKKDSLVIKLRLGYYNTTSTKKMFKFMEKAASLFQKGHDIKIVWEYEDGDEDAMTDGEVFKKQFNIPFTLKKI